MKRGRKEIDVLSGQAVRRRLSLRTVDSICPQLRQYLSPSDTVLDVGCGVGSITCDVASIVAPGYVHCIDVGEPNILQAL